MKRNIFVLAAATALCCGCSLLSNITVDQNTLASAASTAMTAISITDEQIAQLSAQSVAQLDASSKVDNGAYARRIQKLFGNLKSVDNIPLNFKVYQNSEINAFACGDGSIRVYSGLMDAMDDDELTAIIGHKIGHVVHKDTKAAMKQAYLTYAAAEALGSVSGTIGELSKGAIGSIAQSYLSAQFSQKQEYAADNYGFQFAINRGYGAYSMYKALNKLLTLSNSSGSASLVQKMFSSHPGTEERAERMKQAAVSYKK